MGRSNRKYVATLAVAAGLVLAVGTVIRPRVRLSEQAPLSDTDLARLERLTQRRALESATAFLARVADDVAPALVWLDAPGVTGVTWADQMVATVPFEPASASVAVTTSLGIVAASGAWRLPDAPVGALVTGGSVVLPPSRARSPADPGAPVVVVWRSSEARLFAPATFIDEAGATCHEWPGREVHVTLTLTPAMAGGGVFDLDGALLAVILPCGDRWAAVTASTVDDWIRTTATVGHRLRARYGLVLDPLTPLEVTHFGVASGALVRELQIGGAAEIAGLRPGDVIVAVDDAPVSTPDDLRTLAASTALPAATLTVRRGPTRLELSLDADRRAVAEGIVWESPPRGLRIESMPASSALATAGLRAGDRLLRVGDRERQTPALLRQAVEAVSGPPVFVEYERAGRRRGALLVRGER